MNQDSATEQTKKEKNTSISLRYVQKIFVWLLVLGLLGGGAWLAYQNPQWFEEQKPAEKNEKIRLLENQINQLSNRLSDFERKQSLSPSSDDIAQLNEKIENVSKINSEIIDSKASNAAILGIISRLDTLEIKVKKLGRISSQGALILTAAMLVKDSVNTGKPFVYEATVLKNLALGTDMEKPALLIAQYAPQGIVSQTKLVEEFDLIYKNNLEAEIKAAENNEQNAQKEKNETAEKNWKDTLQEKIGELIIIEKHEKDSFSKLTNSEDEIYRLVHENKEDLACIKMQSTPKYQTEAFSQWCEKLSARQTVLKALSEIEASTLGFMKAENLKQ